MTVPCFSLSILPSPSLFHSHPPTTILTKEIMATRQECPGAPRMANATLPGNPDVPAIIRRQRQNILEGIAEHEARRYSGMCINQHLIQETASTGTIEELTYSYSRQFPRENENHNRRSYPQRYSYPNQIFSRLTYNWGKGTSS